MSPDKTSFEYDSYITSGLNLSYLLNMSVPFLYPSFKSDLKLDVLIIGDGILRLTPADFFSSEDKSLAIVEDGNIGSGKSCKTALDQREEDILKEGRHKVAVFSDMTCALQTESAFFSRKKATKANFSLNPKSA
jgi:hypothetical protein